MKKSGFKMKSWNKTSFKEMGSSPLLGKGDNLKRIMSEKKELAKKLGYMLGLV